MGLIDSAIEAFRNKDTIFYKEDSELQDRYDALIRLNDEYPNNENIKSELYNVKKGLEGENEISYQLKKAHIGMYVLRDVKVKYDDLTAQIDYVIITPIFTYYIECKNLIGNITVNDKGDFIREYTINGKKIKKGMYSPLRQVEAQREVMRKIWESNASKLKLFFGANYFDYYRRVLVVAANHETILNTKYAPQEMKYKILRADGLVRQIEYDLDHRRKDDVLFSNKKMEEIAKSYLDMSYKEEIDYYEYYKEKFCADKNIIINDDLRDRLIELRKTRSTEMKIPAYYVFTNDELDKLVEVRPKTIEELKSANILSSVKINTHGEQIINEINRG